jgi:hypothetical protein
VIALAALPFIPNPPALALPIEEGCLAFLSESEMGIVNKPKPPQGGFFLLATTQ